MSDSVIRLSKESPIINLSKQSVLGLMKANLNWDQPAKPTGLFSFLKKNEGIDLDLGAFVRLKSGKPTVIQALGKRFGSVDDWPYVQLQDDDRTGQNTDGEWLHISGEHWDQVKEVLIYAFIYEGVPNWAATNATLTLHIPGHPEIHTDITASQTNQTLCAFARIVNDKGGVKVERLDRYFSNQSTMDRHYNWGFEWTPGHK
jgi:tellurite resistance protein TerA